MADDIIRENLRLKVLTELSPESRILLIFYVGKTTIRDLNPGTEVQGN